MSPFRLSVRTLRGRNRRAQAPHSQHAARPASIPAAWPASEPAYAIPVPWRVVRRAYGVIEIEYIASEPAFSVRCSLAGAGLLGLSLPSTVRTGERVRIALRGIAAEDAAAAYDAILVLRWFQGDGTELLWPIVIA